MLTDKNRMPKVGKQPHCHPKLCGVKFVPGVACGIVIGRVRIYYGAGWDAQAAVIATYKLGIL